MSKSTYYFQHDYEPTSDPKIQAMIGEYGAAGYGLFWRIVEMLHSNQDHKLPKKEYIYLAIAKQMGSDVDAVKGLIGACCNTYDLLSCDNDFFWSERVFRNVDKLERIKQVRRDAISKRWDKKPDTNVLQTNTNVLQTDTKERKGKERKRKEIYNPYGVEGFLPLWQKWIDYKKAEHRDTYKTEQSENAAIDNLHALSHGNFTAAEKIIQQSIANRWKGLFELKNSNNGTKSGTKTSNAGAIAFRDKVAAQLAGQVTAS